MAKFIDLNGLWTGSYGYPGGLKQHVSFTAWVDDENGTIGGTILEPNTFAATPASELSSIISGARLGTDVSFTKLYDPGQAAHSHEILYTGKADSDFTLIVGKWRIGGWVGATGTFEMSRQSGAFTSLEAARSVELVE